MKNDERALIYLRSHNEVDQISPIIYKLGERGNIVVDVVLKSSIGPDDYRLQAIKRYNNVTICKSRTTNKKLPRANRVFVLAKDIGRRVPLDIPQKLSNRFVQPSEQLPIPDHLSNNEYNVVAFDWSHAKGEQTIHFANNIDITTIVLPHGDSPFINNIEAQIQFDRFIKNNSYFTRHVAQNEIGYESYKAFLEHNFVLFPNNLTADRMPKGAPEKKIKVFGSPRYNREWLDILSKIRPRDPIHTDAELNVVFFLRRGGYFVSENEVKNSLKLLNQFDEVSTIAKEHPRERLLSPDTADEMENVTIVKDEISSASLIEWGDIFLSLGTTITFEPIMRQKPVLAIEYAHANHSVVSDYFSNATLRTKEDLYHAIHRFLKNGNEDFYDEREYNKFVEEMISPSENPVLDSWAEFIELQCQ